MFLAFRTLKAKLLASFLVAALLMGAVGGFGVTQLAKIRDNGHKTAVQSIDPLSKSVNLYSDFYSYALFSEAAVGHGKADAPHILQLAGTFVAKIPGDLDALSKAQFPTNGSHQTFLTVQADWKAIQDAFAANSSGSAEAAGKAAAAINKFSADVTALIHQLQTEALKADHSSADVYSSAKKGFGAALGGGLVVMVIFALVISTRLVRPIRKTVDVLNDVAAGDLTKRLDVKRADELGQMAVALNTSLSTVHDVIRQIDSDADKLSEFASQTSRQTDELVTILGKQDEATNQILTNTKESAASLSDMADNLNVMTSIFVVEPADA